MNPLNHIDYQSDVSIESRGASGFLSCREVIQIENGAAQDIQDIFSRSMANSRPFQPSSSCLPGLPSSGAEVDLSPFDLNLGGVDLSAQPSASQPAGGLDFQQLQPSAATNLPQDHRYASLAVGNQGPTSAFPPGFFDDLLVEVGQPAEPLVGTTVDQRGGELDLNFDQPSASQPAFLGHGGFDFDADLQQHQLQGPTIWPQDAQAGQGYASRLAVGNHGPPSALPPGFFDDLLVEVGQPAEPLVGATVDQRGGELDLNFDQPSAQLGQGARPSASQPAFLGHGGFDFDADLQQHQLQGTTTWLQDAQVWQGFADMAVGNHGPPAAFLSDFLDDFPVVAQGAAPAAVGQPAEPLVGVPVGQQEEALDLNFDQPSASQPAFLGHGGFDFDADLQQHQLQGTTTWLQDAQVWQRFADMAVRNHGPTAAFLPDFLDDFPVVAQGAAPAAVGQPAEPLSGASIEQREAALDLNWEQTSSQADRDFGDFLLDEGYDPDQFPFEPQEQSALLPNRRFRRSDKSRLLIYHNAAEQWDREKNGQIGSRTCGISEVVWWKCKKNHEWQASIHSRCRGEKPSACPECRLGQKKYLRDHAAAGQWHPNNGPIGEITCGSNKRVLWKCDQGHEWRLSIYDRCKKEIPSSCPECMPRKKRGTRQLSSHRAAEQWNEEKNGSIEGITCGMGTVVWWKCEKNHEWEARIYDRCKRDKPSACPECRLGQKKYLRDHAAADQWHSKNGLLENQTCGMDQVVWWQCEKGHEWEARIADRCKREKPSPCPECQPRQIRYLRDHAASDQWNEEKNGPIKDETCGMGSSVWWKCEKGHEWEARIANRCKRKKPSPCPECRLGQWRYLKNHAAADQWHPNNDPIGEETCSSLKRVLWRCEKGHEWQASIRDRCKKERPSACPECRLGQQRYLKDHTAADQWHPNNGPIGEITCGSSKRVLWKCDQGHEWEARISDRCKKEIPSSCPGCTSRKKRATRQLSSHRAAEQWNEEKNGPIGLQTCGMRTVVWWKCEKNHEWEARIYDRCKGEKPSACPECRLGQKKYLRDHAAADQWNVAKNGPIKDETCGMNRVVWWRCNKGHNWEGRIADRCRMEIPSSCPKCEPRQIRYLRDHAASNQWVVAKNGPIKDETCGMGSSVWWKCEKGHEWEARIANRCKRKKPSPCPECRLGQQRYLRDHTAADQWNVAKNGSIKDETCGLRRLVWWECDQGHEWQTSIHSRCRGKKPSPCPKCRLGQQRYLRDHAVADQWNVAKNGPIGEITCGSGKRVLWKCDQGHEWEARIYDRCKKETPSSCPKCESRQIRYLRDHAAADQWDVAKNGLLENQTCGMGSSVWWRCEKGHEWEASIHNRCREKKPSACPECKTKKKKRAAEEPLEDQPAQKRQREENSE